MADWNPQANDLFLRAVEIAAPDQRQAFLDEQCGGDAALRSQVEGLLADSAKVGSFLNEPALARPVVTADYQPPSEGPGTIIGAYKLLQQIGEGGFGVVYMAEQQHPVRRMVALKIIKPGMDTAQVIARFESERQALALMDHPHIAKVLDAGATGVGHVSNVPPGGHVGNVPHNGRPYFVMELVKGVPITDFCDKNHLPPEARLKLFIDICHAIQHAHHKGVIHRDIKPSNVMVTLHDGVPVVKVIDFGVAKATGQKMTERTLFTQYGQMIGTPAYMSPEQAEMSGLDIDTRSDIYSLGVLLYELLTGTTPLESKRLREAGYAEMQRLIREEEPPRPSNRLSSLKGSATVLAGNRGLDARGLVQLLAADLDWVVMKALEKDRNRRYATPGSFAEDIERYLRREAILARPPSPAYKLKKFAQRNRATVLTAAAVAAAVLLGSVVSIWQAVRATEAARRAESLNAFLTQHFLTQVEPGRNPRDRPLTLEGSLKQASQTVGQYFANQPELEASIRHQLGVTYIRLGEGGQAVPHLERALALRRELYGPNRLETLDTADRLATALQLLGRLEEAEALMRANLETSQRCLGRNHEFAQQCMNNLSSLLYQTGRIDEGESLCRECLDLERQHLGPEHLLTLITENNLATFLERRGKLEEAEALMRRNRETLGRCHGPDHPNALQCERNFVMLLWTREKWTEAEAIGRRNLEAYRRVYGPDHDYTLWTLGELEKMAREWMAHDGSERAEPLLRWCLEIRHKDRPDHWTTFNAHSMLGGALLGQKKYADAAGELGQGYEGLKQREATLPADGKERLTAALWLLVQVYDAWGNRDEAAKWLTQLEERKELDPESDEVKSFAAKVKLAGDARDANAEQWVAEATAGKMGSLEGAWSSRWNFGHAANDWIAGTATVKKIGDRFWIYYKDRDGACLVQAKLHGKSRLAGRYLNTAGELRCWVGEVVTDERIDGAWTNPGRAEGRWDLRRKLADKQPAER
jgi:serine/threonine protein kinase/Tfp pilus assembly protein PilF